MNTIINKILGNKKFKTTAIFLIAIVVAVAFSLLGVDVDSTLDDAKQVSEFIETQTE